MLFGDHFVIYVSFLSLLCCLVCSLQPCDQLLGRAGLLALLCVMRYCVLHFLLWRPGLGVLLDWLIHDLCLLPELYTLA